MFIKHKPDFLSMNVIYGLSPGEVLVIVAVAIVISFVVGLWTGKNAYGAQKKKKG
jgi:hypothetical protein